MPSQKLTLPRSIAATIALITTQLGCDLRALETPSQDAGGYTHGDASMVSCTNPLPFDDGCGPTELCGTDGDGNGLDDDCNGFVDEGCACTPGSVESCFVGPPGKRGVGGCSDGNQTCGAGGAWVACIGSRGPTPEVCDGVDNDCNGCPDDGLSCDHGPTLTCPTTVPDTTPFADVTYPGPAYFDGNVSKWTWTITGGPCDQMFLLTTGEPPAQSFSVGNVATATPTASYTLAGDYNINMSARSGGRDFSCQFVQHVVGPGVRVELCWDTGARSDLDLHVHQPSHQTNFFGANKTLGEAWGEDCNFINCLPPLPPDALLQSGKPAVLARPRWGYPATGFGDCEGDNQGGTWMQMATCANPRLDYDVTETFGVPENTNIDNPNDGDSFRVLVHYYGINTQVLLGGGAFDPPPPTPVGNPDDNVVVLPTHPMVNVYCAGHLKASYGQAPDVVPNFTTAGGWARGSMWRVADVVAVVDASGTTTDCKVTALHPGNASLGYRVGMDDISFEGQ